MITVTAFKWVPPFAQGFVRDLRVRWALEEAGMGYKENLIGFPELQTADHRAKQPFGQVPVFEEDGKVLFESGAIVQHIALRSDKLAPADAHGRDRMTTWMFAAMNSIEPFVQQLNEVDDSDEPWAKLRRPQVLERTGKRLRDLDQYMTKRDFLEERFTAADILMTMVLREVPPAVMATCPNLDAYIRRMQARPAFKKAFADHMAPFAKNAPPAPGAPN